MSKPTQGDLDMATDLREKAQKRLEANFDAVLNRSMNPNDPLTMLAAVIEFDITGLSGMDQFKIDPTKAKAAHLFALSCLEMVESGEL